MNLEWLSGRMVSLFLICLLCSCDFSVAPNESVVRLTKEEFDGYWRQLERRLPAWTEAHGFVGADEALARRDEVRTTMVLVERDPADLATCSFRPPNLVQVGSDKWDSGCVPHELGHFALWLIHFEGWCNFEHHEEDWKRCPIS